MDNIKFVPIYKGSWNTLPEVEKLDYMEYYEEEAEEETVALVDKIDYYVQAATPAILLLAGSYWIAHVIVAYIL